MIYREYGLTGKKVSVLGAGGMRYSNPDDIDAMAQIPIEAAKLGVNYFDTAPFYCGDHSEEILSIALAEMRRQNLPYFVSTKTSEADYDAVRAAIDRSLERLKIDRITFMHCWCITSLAEFRDREKRGAISALMRARDEGLVEHVVVSTHMSSAEISQMLSSGYFEGMTIGFNAINFPYREAGVADAASRNMGLAVMNPLGGGEIMNNPERFDFIRQRPEQSLLEGALHFVMGHPGVSTMLVGFRNVEDVKTAAAAVDTFVPSAVDGLAGIRLEIERGFDSLCTTCNYCDGCPRGIPVVKFMEAYNSYALYKDSAKVIDRLKWHWDIVNSNILSACIGCDKCVRACTQHLPILERFDEIQGMYAEAEKKKAEVAE